MSRREQRAWRHRQNGDILRQVRKAIKRNRKQKRVRRKDWTVENWEETEQLDHIAHERVMPLGEQERRRRVWSDAVQGLAQGRAEHLSLSERAEVSLGTVVEISEGLQKVMLEEAMLLCSLRGTLTAEDTGFTNVVAVGDEVVVSTDGGGQGVIESVMPRRSALSRPDVAVGHLRQVIVANADQLLIVSSWRDPLPWLELSDRYLITAGINHLVPVICLNKVDLADNRAACRSAMEPYRHLGHSVMYTSALTGEGVAELHEVLRGRTTVLAGMSGVGKSSLLGAVQPGLSLRIEAVSGRRHEGRHTTSQVRLLSLAIGGFVADTPGIREFGLAGLRKRDLMWHYPEIVGQANGCRFADCTHVREPGCAVRSAVEQGDIPKTRYHSYQRIFDSLPE
jgi:ribosome biogenesis GTPase